MSDCLFCKIAAGEIPSNKVYEDDQVFAFYDIDPQAPTHFLVIPKAHIGSCGEITADNAGVVAHIFEVISKVTAQLGITDFRVVSNCGEQAGQSVPPLLLRVRGGGDMPGPRGEPPKGNAAALCAAAFVMPLSSLNAPPARPAHPHRPAGGWSR